MDVAAGMGPHMHPADVGAYAKRVEALGFSRLHVAEMTHDPFVIASLALAATSTLHVRTAVALAFVRSPMVSALAAWDLAHLSDGRFDLGLGSQVRANIEERYGMDFSRPVARLAEHLDAVTACFTAFSTGEPVAFEGAFHSLTRLQPDFRPARLGAVRQPELWTGGVGVQMVALAGRVADGLVTHPTNSHPIDLDQRLFPALDRGAAQAGRVRPPVVASPLIATGRTAADVAASVATIKKRLAFLYSTPAYWPTLVALGYDELGPALRERTRQNQWDQLDALVTDEVVRDLAPVATFAELPGLLLERYGGRAQGIVLRPPADPNDDEAFAAVVAELAATSA